MQDGEDDMQRAIVPTEMEAKDLAAVMEAETEKRSLITRFIGEHMVKGTDYGTIMIGGRASKPSLFKPGSEKFLSLFRLTARFEKDADTWSMAGSEAGTFAYTCLLYASNGTVVGEGRGVSKLSEKSGWTINNAVKIAEKRAQIDAVLRTGALSDFFTQDLEDMQQEPRPAYTVRKSAYQERVDADDVPLDILSATLADVDGKKETEVVSDDVTQFMTPEEASEVQKTEIKMLVKKLGKIPTPSAVLKLTGITMIPANYPDIIASLKGEIASQKGDV